MSPECPICLTPLSHELSALQCTPVVAAAATGVPARVESSPRRADPIEGGVPGPLTNAAFFTIPHDPEEVPRLRRQIADLEEEVDKLVNDLSLLEVDYEQLESEKDLIIESLRADVDKLKLERHADQCRHETELDNIAFKYREAERALGSMRAENHALGRENELLQRQLEGSKGLRIAKDLERVLTELSEAQTRGLLRHLSELPREELTMHCEILTLHAKKRERELHEMSEELRRTKVELEHALRQARRLATKPAKPAKHLISHDLSVDEPSPTSVKKAALEAPSIESPSLVLGALPQASRNSFGLPMAGSALMAPPKFAPLRQHSTISDGIGGHKKALPFPSAHK